MTSSTARARATAAPGAGGAETARSPAAAACAEAAAATVGRRRQSSSAPRAAVAAAVTSTTTTTTSKPQAGRRARPCSDDRGGHFAGEATGAAVQQLQQQQRPSRRRRVSSTLRPLLTLATAATAAALLLLAPRAAVAIPPDYDPLAQNRTCTYTARGVKASVFFKGGPRAGLVRDLIDSEPNGAAAKAATATTADSSSAGVVDSATLFPLDAGAPPFRSNASATAATACFGPGEAYDSALVISGVKHNCRWRWSPRADNSNGGGGGSGSDGDSIKKESDPDALVDFEEEQACLPVLTSNCYCYSVGRSPGSYCDPGLAGLGEGVQFPIDDCSPVVKGVVADGGRPVRSEEIREVQAGLRRPPTKGHYIGLAVMPSWEDKYNTGGDFHFWRMDSSLSWSYKAGDTFVRHTLFPGKGPPSEEDQGESSGNSGNATATATAALPPMNKKNAARNSGFGLVQAAPALRDLEEPSSRGPYTKFCGYFHVDPKTHRMGAGSGYSFSDVPVKYALWQSATAGGLLGPEASVSVLPRDSGPSEGWLGQYRKDYVDLGWCDEDTNALGGGAARDGRAGARESGSRGGFDGGDAKRTRSAVPAAARERGRRGLVAREAV